MKKVFFMGLALSACCHAAWAEESALDTLKALSLQDVVVKGVRADRNAPFAQTNIKAGELRSFARTGQELPFLFARTPGVLAWSENGLGTGTAYMRIRGAGDSRINVTLDGVPLNSPEDQSVFWANMNSYAALLGNVQIQRGVGTSSNGDGAFGGTVSLSTRTPSDTSSLEVTGSYGSYNTWRTGASFSTGLLFNSLILDGAYHETSTDGYVHGTAGRSGSYYGGLTWLSDNFTVRFKHIGNFERTGQAWNGVIAGDYDGYAPLDATYGRLHDMGLGRLNSLYERVYADGAGRILSERYRMKDGTYWDRTTDMFRQGHNILSGVWTPTDRWSATATLHYTHGYGYYEEFRYNNKLSKYGLPNLTLADGSTLKKTDFVRRKGLRQDACGALWNANYKHGGWDVVTGMNYQHFKANHFGYLTYMKDNELAARYLSAGRYQYYDSDARKTDFALFAKATYTIAGVLDLFADMQYRHVGYTTDGYNDKYYSDLSKNYLAIDKAYDFLNPKAGMAYHKGGHKAYASIASARREPERNNFTDNGKYPAPKAEQLTDIEVGYEYTGALWHVALGGYYMHYHDQFVQTGETSDIGEALTTNVKSSYRTGLEMSAGVRPLPWLLVEGNLSLSANRIKDFDEVIEDWDSPTGTRTTHYTRSTLPYSPAAVANLFVTGQWRAFRATWHTAGHSRQHLDLSGSRQRALPGYGVSNLSATYTLKPGKARRSSPSSPSSPRTLSAPNSLKVLGLREVQFGLDLCNIFNRHYAPSGFIWYQYYSHSQRHSQPSYIPSAGFTAMGSLTLKF